MPRSTRPPPSAHREPFLPLRYPEGRVPAVTHVRATAVASSLRALEARGLRDAHAANLAPDAREALLGVLPATWMDVDLALAHYRAIDALGLTPTEQLALGVTVGETTTASTVGAIFRMSREVGVTPWALMPHAQRLWDRTCQGGDVSIDRVGPKEVIVTLHGLSLFRSPYFRLALRGVFQAGLAMWCSACYVTEIGGTDTTLELREAWA